eukprot:353568-Chlamydomonas_euryale.AAC.3
MRSTTNCGRCVEGVLHLPAVSVRVCMGGRVGLGGKKGTGDRLGTDLCETGGSFGAHAWQEATGVLARERSWHEGLPCRPHAQRAPTFCRPHAQRAPTFCRPHAQRAPTFCRPHAQRAPTFCRPRAQRSRATPQHAELLMDGARAALSSSGALQKLPPQVKHGQGAISTVKGRSVDTLLAVVDHGMDTQRTQVCGAAGCGPGSTPAQAEA